MQPPFKIVGLGEILWDMLPDGKQLGGAPTNFAYMASLLGDEAIVASRVGNDELGAEVLTALQRLGLNHSHVQQDEKYPTGTAQVSVDQNGQPSFTITQPAAWDFLEWTPELRELAHASDAVCFGTLAQRSSVSRETIRQFLRALPDQAVRILDVNLRQSFYSAEMLHASLQLADVVKLNHEELPRVASLLGLDFQDAKSCTRRLLQTYALELVCLTRGGEGSFLMTGTEFSMHSGFRVKVADTVGAGDAFTACLAHHYLRGESLDNINEDANRFAAWAATQRGGTPTPPSNGLEEALERIG